MWGTPEAESFRTFHPLDTGQGQFREILARKTPRSVLFCSALQGSVPAEVTLSPLLHQEREGQQGCVLPEGLEQGSREHRDFRLQETL